MKLCLCWCPECSTHNLVQVTLKRRDSHRQVSEMFTRASHNRQPPASQLSFLVHLHNNTTLDMGCQLSDYAKLVAIKSLFWYESSHLSY